MRGVRRSAILLGFAALSLAVIADTRQPASMAESLSTQEHVKQPGWWPTKGTPARGEYAGNAACAQCHAALVQSQQQHSMARAAMPGRDSEFLKNHVGAPFNVGANRYEISKDNSGDFRFAATDGSGTASGPITWAFGIGKVGQSYISEAEGEFRELRFSYFRSLNGFDLTPNQSLMKASSLNRAAGRIVSPEEIARCFGCHSTASTVAGKFDPAHAIPGLACEGCHGPAAKHVSALLAGDVSGLHQVFNPRRLSPAGQVDFCGACHTTWWDVTLHQAVGFANVRFQPYRLERSRCWGKGDGRLTCTACHDPHKPLVREAASYDSACLSCHVAGAAVKSDTTHIGSACPKAVSNCVTCHMPKYLVEDMHFEYTDHQIRIVRPGEGFPD
ncbi:MAG: hypothetical protein DMG90_03550 [Acidobacteria bacterium]|nr:MAG: hypothetical protein DMG90_03550 [Acidobacteriota bacterium]